jgi:molybdopterin-guanine dinucleotide biosynthesis protein A
MIQHVAAALRGSGLEVLIVGRDSVAGLDAIPDQPGHGGGPAVGLLSAYNHLDTDVLLVAVDQPLLRPETVRQLLALPGDAVVPQADGHPQVTCALFRRSCHEPLRELLASGETKLRRLLDQVDTTFVAEEVWSKWGEDGQSWMSLDTPQAVRDAEALPWRP